MIRFLWARRTSWIFSGAILAAAPLLIFLLWTFGPNDTDQFAMFANLTVAREQPVLGGIVGAGIEPNEGTTSYALGHRAAQDVFSGRWPLWNSYEGLGTPLLGEMQSAALLPFTWLIPLPAGQVLERVLLQFFGGIGAFLFFRRFGLGATAALAGGIAWELNGVFAWMRNAIFNPVAFLPWLFLAVEMIRLNAIEARPFARRLAAICLCAAAAALALYAGFPEEVYLYSLLLIVWVIFLAIDMKVKNFALFVGDLLVAGLLTLALSAPLLVAFVDFLREANISRHAGSGYYGLYPDQSVLLLYLMPYVYGPISMFQHLYLWGGVGGYLGLTPFALAIAALALPRHRGAKILLAVWIVIAVSTSVGTPGIYDAFMTLPLAKIVPVSRYLNTSWIFAAIFLAVLFIDDVAKLDAATARRSVRIGALLAVVCAVIAAAGVWPLLAPLFEKTAIHKGAILAAAATVVVLVAALMAVPQISSGNRAALSLAAILVGEGFAWFVIPYLSYPRNNVVDYEQVRFLESHVGLQRVMMGLGYGFEANYGSVFGISTLNYNDLPTPARTVAYLQRTLDPSTTDIFPPYGTGLSPEIHKARLRTRLSAYANAGVKYLVAGDTFNEALAADGKPPLAAVHTGRAGTVYELPSPRGYFSADGCTINPRSRTRAEVTCDTPSRLVRLEVYMRGWTAQLNGKPASLGTEDGTFQAVVVPAGASVVTFNYKPTGFSAAVAAAGIALLIVMGACVGATRRMSASQLP